MTTFANWTRPATAVEVLEQSLEFAKEEKNWAEGAIFSLKTNEVNQYCPVNPDSPGLCDNVAACAMGIIIIHTFDGPAIKAYYNAEEDGHDAFMEWDDSYMVMPRGTSLGEFEMWDPEKEATNEYTGETYKGEWTMKEGVGVTESMVKYYPPAAEATMFLAQAAMPREGKPKNIDIAVSTVIRFNDAGEQYGYKADNEEYYNPIAYKKAVPTRFGEGPHHQKVVRLFERALELAKEAEAVA